MYSLIAKPDFLKRIQMKIAIIRVLELVTTARISMLRLTQFFTF